MAGISSVGFDSNNSSLNLLSSLARVEIPFIKVVIGDYTFGVYDSTSENSVAAREAYTINNIQYPNYIKSLEITKINGQVNQYKLDMFYQITTDSDPNFFEKVFASVGLGGTMLFSYGDLSMPTFIYRDEEALITNVTSTFDCKNAAINYTVNAVSSATLLDATVFPYFPARHDQPSKVIMELLQAKKYGLQEIFYGMKNIGLVNQYNLIAKDDKIVDIKAQTNMSILEYITYLVSCMTPTSDNKTTTAKTGLYVINVVDDVSGVFQGPYFTIRKVNSSTLYSDNGLSTYTIDMGYPSQNIVLDFTVDDNQTYSVYEKYTNGISQEKYRWRINSNGQMEPIYAPMLSSGNPKYQTTEADRTWWSVVTSYPISATITLKGLLRPALLMSHLKLNMYYYGKKHISSGTYLITQQVDTVDRYGFKTKLSLVRESGDDSYEQSLGINTDKVGEYLNINNGNFDVNYTTVKTSTK